MLQLFSKAQNICAYYLVYLACLWCTQNFPPTSLNFSHHKQHLTEVRNQHTNSLKKKKLQSRATTCHIWVSRGDSAGQNRRRSSLKGNLSIDARGIKRFRLMRTTLCTKEIAGDMSGLIKTNGWWELYIGEAEHANQDPPPTPDTWKWILSFWKWNTADSNCEQRKGVQPHDITEMPQYMCNYSHCISLPCCTNKIQVNLLHMMSKLE